MCSYELLELCEHMPDTGAFKTALRGGEPSEEQLAIRQIANETAVLRAGMVPDADADQYGSRLFFTPAKLRELVEMEQTRGQARDAVLAIGGQ